MRKHFLLCFFSFIAATFLHAQQPLEIVIVASAHNNDEGINQTVIDRLKSFKPEMVFGEYEPASDLKAHPDSTEVKKSYAHKYNYILRRNPGADRHLEKRIRKAHTALARNPNDHAQRIALVRDYVLNHDRGNAEYQIYILENHMKRDMGQKDLHLYQQVLGTRDSLRKLELIRTRTEYETIFFPLIYQLQQTVIYPMDSQKHNEEWNKKWATARVQVKEMETKAKAEPRSVEALAVQKRARLYKEWDSLARAEKKYGYDFLNTAIYATADAAYNFYGGEVLFSEPGFPAAAVKGMIEVWNLRNEAMCQNIVQQAKEKGAKRVVVAVGASHRKWMEDIFARMPGVKVINYNALP